MAPKSDIKRLTELMDELPPGTFNLHQQRKQQCEDIVVKYRKLMTEKD